MLLFNIKPMKKLFILLVALPLLYTTAIAQTPGFRSGLIFGIGQATIKNSSIDNQTGKLAFLAGFGLNYQFTKYFGLYGNILFVSKGTSFTGADGGNGITGSNPYKQTVSLGYIEIPVMPKLSVGIDNFHFKAFAGPSMNFNLYGKETKTYNDPNYNQNNGYRWQNVPNLSVVEYSFVYGGGFDVELPNNDVLFLEIRDNIGLTSLGQINGINSYNKYFAVAFGYLYTY